MRRSRPTSLKPYSRSNLSPNALAKSPSSGSGTMIAVSVPSYLRLRNTSHSHSFTRSKPCEINRSRQRSASSFITALASEGAAPPCFGYEPANGRCVSATTSANPMPYADRMPQNL